MTAFKFKLIAIHNWNTPVTEQVISSHKTIEQARKMLLLNEKSTLKDYKLSIKNGYKDFSPNTYRIEEIN